MSDMKMSEVFDLPLQRAVNELAIVDKNDCVVGWADAFSGEAARDCIVESINNHERLAEENAELREVLQKISRVSQRTPELNDDYTHEDVGVLNDRIDEVFGIIETAMTKHKA